MSVERPLREMLVRVGTVRIGTGATDYEVILSPAASTRRLERGRQQRYTPFPPCLAGEATH